jgi:HPt (histidine-containing phosphotransfer) domain-containing protein
MVDHISKPIDPASLFETVGRFCKPPGPSAAANPRETSAGAKLKNEPALSGGARPGTLQSSHMTEPEADPDLPAIEGLDTKDGLARVAGNRKLYSKLLRQFGEQNGETIAQISDALKQGDVGVAERLAHTVKGVAGNIGAKPVQTAASKLEKLIREKAGLSETNDAIADLSAVLDPLLAKLRQVYASAPQNTVVESSNTGPVDIAAARMAGERMGQLLAQFDPDAVEALATNQTALRGLFPGDAWLTFEKLVQNYAFADAQVQLEQALRNLPAA